MFSDQTPPLAILFFLLHDTKAQREQYIGYATSNTLSTVGLNAPLSLTRGVDRFMCVRAGEMAHMSDP